jgi:hypothetical protein
MRVAQGQKAPPCQNDELQQQLRTLNEENSRLRDEVASARASATVTTTTALEGVNGPLASEGRGAALGGFNWERFSMEANSTERRFWIKTATNEEGHHFYRRILIQNGWIETSLPTHPDCYFQFYGRFVPNIDGEFNVFKEGKNLINHIPGEFAVLNKEPFLHLMRENSLKAGCDYTLIHPESYLIHTPQDCEDLFRPGDYPSNTFVPSKETQAERDSRYWFWKPPFNSFGRGIKISSLTELREAMGFGKELAQAPNPGQVLKEKCAQLALNLTENKNKLLVQRAVDKPYLIKGAKFDFRAYILIANAKPWSVYFKFGHVRRCMRDFDITSRVKKAHVCNDYSDELENEGFPLDDHIWSLEKYRSYLVGLGYSREDVNRAFVDNLKRLFLNVFKRFKDHLPRKNGYWLLLGLDIAIDENWNCRVLEINTNPSMHYGTKVWGKEIVDRNWRQMNELLELVWDSHLKSERLPVQRSDLVTKTKYGWELIFSEYTQPTWQFSDEVCFTQWAGPRHPPAVVEEMRRRAARPPTFARE